MDIITLEYHQQSNNEVLKQELSFSKQLLTMPYNIESLFVIQVQGESMQPKINDTALVVADLSQKEFIDDAIYLVFYEHKMWIKQAKNIENQPYFVSINPKFSHLAYRLDEVRVIAKALLTFTTL